MNARVKRVKAAQEAVEGKDDWIVVRKLKKRPIFDGDGKFVMWICRVIVDRPNKDWEHEPEAAVARNEINEGINSERYQTY